MAKFGPTGEEQDWIDRGYIEVRRNDHGQLGAFARTAIPPDTLLDVYMAAHVYAVPVINGRLDTGRFGLSFSDTIQISRHGDIVYCIGDARRDDLTGIDFVNHSCQPNCAIRNCLQLWSLVDIRPGEELLFDYRELDIVPEGIECWCDTEKKCVI